MSYSRKFIIGGLGALLPVLVSLLAIDIAGVVDHWKEITVGTYVGYVLRDLILFVLGGVIAALNTEVTKPLTLVQLGIAAPALITSFINGSAVASKSGADVPVPSQGYLSVFPPAYADEETNQPEIIVAWDAWGDILQGFTKPLGSVKNPPAKVIRIPPQALVTYEVRITNTLTGKCMNGIGRGSGGSDIDSWRRNYRPPEYDVQRGRCPQ
jgi:hypothetical protein